ncbi:hypothetical protein JK358_12640 [Nocardia sp. 2]|uniref:Outer membrane channel protein CpnT-like N-terminal domain-containing protein n=1 Tax=Nocardia acididurans TaxID=2802282 RepID=A0ABS1M3Y6_9NOCA|nr:hypothetical protein [Nocardia acididurans]MBL1075241.1 hypothetical protein [Nocardia acididurans]
MNLEFGAYYSVGRACFGFTDALQTAFLTEMKAMSSCDAMAGADEEGVAWAKDYDERAAEVLTLVSDLGEGVTRLGRVIIQNGYTHYLADYNSTLTKSGAPAAMPEMPMPVCNYYGSPTSAGGSRGGYHDAVDSLVELAGSIGIAVPDGDTDDLQTAADAWNRLQNNYTANLASVLSNAATVMDGCDAEDAAVIAQQLRGLQTALDDILAACGELSKLCTDYKDDLWNLREKMLKQILEELAITIATEWAISVATSWITFGASLLVAGAATAATATVYGARIAAKIGEWRAALQAAKAARAARRDLQKSKDAAAKAKQLDGDSNPAALWNRLTDDERAALLQGPNTKNGESLTAALRNGTVTPEQQAQIDAFNRALNKLPTHEGAVTRFTNLTPEQLARYEPGKPHTEVGFTSSSVNPRGVNEFTVQNSKVEFQIVSKTGRDYSQYGTPDEVLFPSGTNFFVKSKVFDPATGRTVIQMVEM